MSSSEVSNQCSKAWSASAGVWIIDDSTIGYYVNWDNACSSSHSDTLYISYTDPEGNQQSTSIGDFSFPANTSSNEDGEMSLAVHQGYGVSVFWSGSGGVDTGGDC